MKNTQENPTHLSNSATLPLALISAALTATSPLSSSLFNSSSRALYLLNSIQKSEPATTVAPHIPAKRTHTHTQTQVRITSDSYM